VNKICERGLAGAWQPLKDSSDAFGNSALTLSWGFCFGHWRLEIWGLGVGMGMGVCE